MPHHLADVMFFSANLIMLNTFYYFIVAYVSFLCNSEAGGRGHCGGGAPGTGRVSDIAGCPAPSAPR